MTINANKDSPVFSQEAFNYLLEWTSQLTSHYSETGETPEKGWEMAHHPTPKYLKGTDTVWMKREHHAIHGILQSRAFGEPCTSGLYSPLMKNTEWWDEHQHWLSLAGKKANAARKNLRAGGLVTAEKTKKPCRLTNIDTGRTYDFLSLRGATFWVGPTYNLSNLLSGKRGRCGRYTGTYI